MTAAVLLRRCCRNATNYFGQDCYNNPNSDRGVDYYHYHAAMGGWNTSTLNAGPLFASSPPMPSRQHSVAYKM